MLVVQCNCFEIVKVFFEYGVNVDVRDFENKIVLYYVIGSFDIVKEIFKVSINL